MQVNISFSRLNRDEAHGSLTIKFDIVSRIHSTFESLLESDIEAATVYGRTVSEVLHW